MSSLTGNEYQQICFLLQPQVLPLCFNGVGVTVFLRFLSAVMSIFPFSLFFLFFLFSSFLFNGVLFMYRMFSGHLNPCFDAKKNVLD